LVLQTVSVSYCLNSTDEKFWSDHEKISKSQRKYIEREGIAIHF